MRPPFFSLKTSTPAIMMPIPSSLFAPSGTFSTPNKPRESMSRATSNWEMSRMETE
ncbi:hypothetical protein P9302_00985 [Brevibacillus agri]|uniref:hypothetical protein n=1 Tax=Brevibacillus agri TaxID=51101 RepID=UPI002E24B091|nr:hypothetical protein [Brevibacillus agri]